MNDSWKDVQLDDIAFIEKSKHGGSPLWYVGMEDIESGTGRLVGSKSPTTVKSSTFSFSREHILYGRLRPYLNKVLLPDATGHCSTEIFPIRPKKGVNRRWLFYWFIQQRTVEKIHETCTGARMPRANMKEVMRFRLCIPDLREQDRIVAILDEAFAGIERAIANVEKNLGNARELFESHLENAFSRSAHGWEERTLGELYEIGSSKRVHKKDWRKSGVPFYRAREIVKLAESGSVENDLFIAEDQFEEFSSKTGAPSPGDLMVTAVGTLGICYVVQPGDRFYFKDASVLWFRPKSKINEQFIRYAFRSPIIRKQTTDSQGATVGTLTITRANSISISIPNLEKQAEVAGSLEAMESQVRALEERLTTKRSSLQELKQSILQKAFSGELTADGAEREAEAATV